MRTALTIAGSDSGGGAGIQADLKSFAAVGVHGTSVLTCVTAQNTRTVASIFPLPPEEIRQQLRAVLEDFDVRAAKTGMLYSAEIVAVVAEELRGTDFPLVVDPVMVATVGARLERDDFRDALVDRLLPRATLVTPNRHETERLSGRPVKDLADMEEAAREILRLGPQAVLVKGGHVAGELVDVFYDGRTMRHLRGFRYDKELHGAGCTLAASIAGYLALGKPLLAAVESGRRRVAAGFLSSYRAGHGVEIIHSHFQPDRYEVWLSVTDAAEKLRSAMPKALLEGSQAVLGFALPGAGTPADVCASVGPVAPRGPLPVARFGGSPDIARALLAAMHADPRMRATIHLKLPLRNARRLRSAGLVAPRKSPRTAKGEAGWGRRIKGAIAEAGTILDTLAFEGEGGSLDLWFFGQDPADAVRKVLRLGRSLAR